MDAVTIFDTTLRDGEQSPGASLTMDEKLVIARQLERLGVDVIEAGFPISSPGDFEAVRLIAQRVRGPVICGLARCVERDIDAAAEAVAPAERKRIHVFIATSKIHMEKKLRKSPEEVHAETIAAVRHARRFTDDVEFSPEDATRSDPDFLARIVEAAIGAGATTVNIPDTVGYAVPHEFGARIRALRERVPNIDRAIISVHCHNDLGLAVANSLAAVAAGARQVECTINGLGERAGNAALEEIAMALRMRGDQLGGAATRIRTREIWNTSRLVANLTGIDIQRNKAIVGLNAFAHEAGIHQHGVISDPETYEIMRAADVGWQGNQLVIGKHSGHHAVGQVLESRGYRLEEEQLRAVLARVKEVADRQKQIEDEDIVAIAREVMEDLAQGEQRIQLEELAVMTGNRITPTATVRVSIDGIVSLGNAVGVGPVDAASKALRIAIDPSLRLSRYGLKAITGGTDALAHAMIEFEDEEGTRFHGEAIDEDVIMASVRAMVKGANRAVTARRLPGNEKRADG
ncbi:MAG: 2-isopropylmalate synthase [Planctomycetes bacterium]|nr:2-isopropylmalate synthase [Planctomycetota bacterium]